MAALMIDERTDPAQRVVDGPRPDPRRSHLNVVRTPAPASRTTPVARYPRAVARPTPRVSAATYRRRRLVAVGVLIASVLVAGRAGATLGGTSLAAAGRGPSVVRYVVQPGDSLWTAAGELAPDEDPRAVVDALVQARGDEPLQPGEVLRWQR